MRTVSIILLSTLLAAQTRDKRVTPVDSAVRQIFDKQIKIPLPGGAGNYPHATQSLHLHHAQLALKGTLGSV
jgi:hypothetical protein